MWVHTWTMDTYLCIKQSMISLAGDIFHPLVIGVHIQHTGPGIVASFYLFISLEPCTFLISGVTHFVNSTYQFCRPHRSIIKCYLEEKNLFTWRKKIVI